MVFPLAELFETAEFPSGDSGAWSAPVVLFTG